MLTNQRNPAYYQGDMTGDGLERISALYPAGSSETLPIPRATSLTVSPGVRPRPKGAEPLPRVCSATWPGSPS